MLTLMATRPVPAITIRPAAMLGAMSALVLVLLPHVGHVPLWCIPLCIVALLWRWTVVARGWPLPNHTLLALLTLASGVGVVLSQGTLFGRDAGTTLLVVMAALKLLEARQLRDLQVLVLLGYLLLMSNLLYSQELPMAMYLFIAGAWLLSVQLRISDNHQALSMRESVRFASVLLAQALPVMLVLFILFPRVPGPLWTLPSDAHSRSGLDDKMDPNSISKLTLSDEVAFRVRFSGAVPAEAQRYWRGLVLSNYDGRTWHLAEELPQNKAPKLQSVGTPTSYSVILEPHGRRWLFALDLPQEWPDDAKITRSYQLVRQRPIHETLRYEAVSSLNYRTLEPLSEFERRQNLALPPYSNPKARALAAEWRLKLAPEQRVQAALTMIREEQFFYTLEPPPLPDVSPIDAFWFGTRSGFCEHYAGALTFLMRSAGVPARVVTGYLGGQYSDWGNYLIVRQSDAHAWVEVWLADQGWVRVDPTGAISPFRVEPGRYRTISDANNNVVGFTSRAGLLSQWSEQALLIWDSVNNLWTEMVLAYGPNQQHEFLSNLLGKDVDWRDMVISMLIALAILSAMVAGWMWWQVYRTQDRLGRIWLQFGRKLERVRLQRYSHEGPLDYAERIASTRPDLAAQVRAIARVYARLRYGAEPKLSEVALQALRKRVNALKV